MNNMIKIYASALLVFLLAVDTAVADGTNGVEFILTSYLWAAGIDGDLGVGEVSVPVDVGFEDYIGELKGGFLLTGEVRKDHWGIVVDGILMRLGGDGGTPGPFLSEVDVEIDSVILSLALSYRFLENERLVADALVGGRYVYMSQKLELDPNEEAIGTAARKIRDAAGSKLSSSVSIDVDRHKNVLANQISLSGGSKSVATARAVEDLMVDIKGSVVRDRVLAEGGGIGDHSFSQVERRFANAVQSAIAERSAQLVGALSPADQNDPAHVSAAIRRAASESLKDLKNNVSSGIASEIDKAKDALEKQARDAMRKIADADIELSRDWWDPFVGLRTRIGLSDRLALMLYGDIGGFGVGSELTWQVFSGLSWDMTQSMTFEVGYRHLDIDYDHDHFVFDAAISGAAAGLRIRL